MHLMTVLANIFQPLLDIFGPVLIAFHNVIGGSWGWSIIALTVVIRALLLPMAFKQFHSLQKLQRVAPQLKAIQAKHKDDKQRQQQEVFMKFYRENDINPFASFLPLAPSSCRYSSGSSTRSGPACETTFAPSSQHAFQATYAAAHHVSLHAAAGQTTYCTNPAYVHFLPRRRRLAVHPRPDEHRHGHHAGRPNPALTWVHRSRRR